MSLSSFNDPSHCNLTFLRCGCDLGPSLAVVHDGTPILGSLARWTRSVQQVALKADPAEAAAAPAERQEALGNLFSFSARLAPADWTEPESLL